MKILITNFHPEDGGGHTTYILLLAKYLSQHHEVTVAVPASSKLYSILRDVSGVKLAAQDYPGKLKEIGHLLISMFRLKHLLDNNVYDIIHVNGSPDHRLVMYATIGNPNRPRIIFTKHNSYKVHNSIGFRLRSKYFTDAIITVSKHTYNLVHNSCLGNKLVFTIHNGVDTSYYIPNDMQYRNYARRSYNIAESDFVCVSIAGTGRHKGWPTMVEGVSKLPSEIRPKIKIVIAGHIPSDNDIAQYVRKYNLENQVVFTGIINDVRPVCAAGDIGFVLSESEETISFACREMMSMGLPVIVTDFAGLPENIDDHINGWIIKTSDSSAIKDIICCLINDMTILPEMSCNARIKATLNFGIDKFANNTLEAYQMVLSSSGKVDKLPQGT